MADRVRIVAEAGNNHNGRVSLGQELIDTASKCGADYVKFQCFVSQAFLAPGSDFNALLKGMELDAGDFRVLRDHAREAGLPMISTAVDPKGLRIIVDLDLPIIKIGSTNINNYPLLEAISEVKKPVFLSTGGSTLGEIETALRILERGTDDITIFHCTVQYPAPSNLLNLRAIPAMAAAFPGIPVGYSDHSVGQHAAVLAVALGATVLEKHFTTDPNFPGADHSFSVDPAGLRSYIEVVRTTEKMLGSPRKTPTPEEGPLLLKMRRFVAAAIDIPVGTVIEPGMIAPYRIDVARVDPCVLLGPEFVERFKGGTTLRNFARGEPVTIGSIKLQS